MHFSVYNPGIPVVFANLKSQNWQRHNPGISELQKYVKIVLSECYITQITTPVI